MKVIVYAICKNEEQFVDRWYNSVKEADDIYVLDTGSTDNTVKKLKEYGVHVKTKIIDPWRFDIARNESLALVPKDTDICVCLDLDEIILPGWKKTLQNLWQKDTTRLRYNYNWSLDENDLPLINFFIEKIHSRNDYEWQHPVHEVLVNINNNEVFIQTNDITVNHYPDSTKSRSNYLPLLELSVKENPLDDRNMHYLGREYMYYRRWNECIDTLIKHLNLPSSTWKDERCASMRFISRAYKNLKRYDEANMWLIKAIKQAPYLRDPYVEMALLQYELKNYTQIIKYCKKAEKIKFNEKSYINERFSWDYTIYDLLSLSYYYTGKYNLAVKYCKKALNMDLKNKRLKKNLEIMEKELRKAS